MTDIENLIDDILIHTVTSKIIGKRRLQELADVFYDELDFLLESQADEAKALEHVFAVLMIKLHDLVQAEKFEAAHNLQFVLEKLR